MFGSKQINNDNKIELLTQTKKFIYSHQLVRNKFKYF